MNVRVAVCAVIGWGAVYASGQERPSPQLPTVPPGPVLIDDVDEAAVAMHPLSRYLETSSAIVVDIDLSKVKPTEIAEWVVGLIDDGASQAIQVRSADGREIFPDDAATRQQVAIAEGAIGAFRNAGADHLYFSAAPRSWFDGGPLVVIPCENSAAVNGLVSMALGVLPKDPPQGTWVEPGVFVAGAQAAIDRVREQAPVHRGDLILPLTSPDRLDHMIVFSLPPNARDELAAIWPNRLPKAAPVELSPQQLVRDVEGCVIEWSLPPEPEARVTILGSSNESSRRIVLQLDRFRQAFPVLDSLVRVAVDETSVRVELRIDAAVEQARGIVRQQRESGRKEEMSNLRQVGLAIHNYHEAHGHLPPRCFVDPDGNSLLNGRIGLLPFLEQRSLYDSIRLDRSWDDEANRTLRMTAVPVFRGGSGFLGDPTFHGNSGEAATPTDTPFRFPVFPGSAWEGDGPPRRLSDITDGTSNTIAMIAAPAKDAIHWASPEPWTIAAEDPIGDVFGDRDEVVVLMFDGSVLVLGREETDRQQLEAMLTFAGGEPVDLTSAR